MRVNERSEKILEFSWVGRQTADKEALLARSPLEIELRKLASLGVPELGSGVTHVNTPMGYVVNRKNLSAG